MHDPQQTAGAADDGQLDWVNVYVRVKDTWKLASQGWQERDSDQMAERTSFRARGLPIYVVRWGALDGRLFDGLYTPKPAWVPRPDGMVYPGGVYRWSIAKVGTAAAHLEMAQGLGFVNVQSWPIDAMLPDDWPAEDRDPSRWRMQGALPNNAAHVNVPDATLWKLDIPRVQRTWVPVSSVWVGNGGKYRMSGASAKRTAREVSDNLSKLGSIIDVLAWGPDDPLPPDWPTDDLGPGRNRFQLTVRRGAQVIEVPAMRVWAWSVPVVPAPATPP